MLPTVAQREFFPPLKHGLAVHRGSVSLLSHGRFIPGRNRKQRWPSFLGLLETFSRWDEKRTLTLLWRWSKPASSAFPTPQISHSSVGPTHLLRDGSRVAQPGSFLESESQSLGSHRALVCERGSILEDKTPLEKSQIRTFPACSLVYGKAGIAMTQVRPHVAK